MAKAGEDQKRLPHVVSASGGRDAGDKPALLFVHGAWHSSWCWKEHYFGFFTKAGFDCYAVDLPGHGGTPSKGQLRFTGIGSYVEAVEAAVAMIERPVIVIGHSMGGYTLQHFLGRNRVQGAVLLASVPWYGAIVPTLWFASRHPLKFLKANLTLSLMPMVEDREVAGELMLSDRLPKDKRNACLDRLQNESWLAYIQMVFAKLPLGVKTDVPMLVVAADEDALFSVASQRSLARRYDAGFECISEVGHDIMIEKYWERSAEAILGWIEKQPSA